MNSSPSSWKCLLCGHEQFQTLFHVHPYQIRKCLHCRLAQTYPFTSSASALDDLYDASYFERLAERKPYEIAYQQRILDLIHTYKTSGRMLEVGIGAGFFLELARQHGWNIEGVDPSAATCRMVAQQLDLPIYHANLEELNLPPNTFDVITMRHVLEHVPTPVQFTQKLHFLLKDDGIICIVVPNFGGLHARIERKNWFHLSLPYHLAHYTITPLLHLLKQQGFRPIRWLTTDLSCSSYFVQLANLFLRLFKRPARDVHMNPDELDAHRDLAHWLVAKESLINHLAARLKFGEELVVIAQKRV